MRRKPHETMCLDRFQSGDFTCCSRDKWQLLSDTWYLTKMRRNPHEEMFLYQFQSGDFTCCSRDKW